MVLELVSSSLGLGLALMCLGVDTLQSWQCLGLGEGGLDHNNADGIMMFH